MMDIFNKFLGGENKTFGDAQAMIGEKVMQQIIPEDFEKISSMVLSGIKEYLGDDKKRLQLQVIDGKLYVIVIQTKGLIREMDVKEEDVEVYDIQHYSDMFAKLVHEKTIKKLNP